MNCSQTPELFLKPGAYVRYDNDGVVKKMSAPEVASYEVLTRYRDNLHKDGITLVIPEMLSYDSVTQMALLSKVGQFRSYSPPEYFGSSDVYNPEYFSIVHASSNILRRAIPSDEVPEQADYEAVHDGRISSLEYLSSGLTGNEPARIAEFFEIAGKVASTTQETIEDMPQFASHRDPNPNNYMITRTGDSYHVALVDWETFGLSRVGYDEGRLMSYLALNAEMQEDYAKHVGLLLPNVQNQVYFWRVAVMRSLREAISFSNGHYDSRLQACGLDDRRSVEQRKQVIFDALGSVVLRSVRALQDIGVEL